MGVVRETRHSVKPQIALRRRRLDADGGRVGRTVDCGTPRGDAVTTGNRPEELLALLLVAEHRHRVGNHVGGQERARVQRPSELFGHRGQIHHRLIAHAAPAVSLGHQRSDPAELRPLAPDAPVERRLGLEAGAHRGNRMALFEETARHLPQQLLIIVVREVHGPLP